MDSDALQRVIQSLADEWDLVVDGATANGFEALAVVPVRHAGQRCVLKLTDPGNEEENHEALALKTWDGHGAVRLLRHSPQRGAMLLERADSSRTLYDVELHEAISVVAGLMRVLAVPAPPGPPRLTEIAAAARSDFTSRWEALGRPFPAAVLEQVLEVADQLSAAPVGAAAPARGALCPPGSPRTPMAETPAGSWNLLVDRDLHYGNVLASSREPWLVIDPKVIAGPVEYGVAQLLWTRLGEMDGQPGLLRCFRELVEAAALDESLARSCVLLSCTDYWLWALGAGLTDDPDSCQVIVGTFLSTR